MLFYVSFVQSSLALIPLSVTPSTPSTPLLQLNINGVYGVYGVTDEGIRASDDWTKDIVFFFSDSSIMYHIKNIKIRMDERKQ